jgi:hypothetical protein
MEVLLDAAEAQHTPLPAPPIVSKLLPISAESLQLAVHSANATDQYCLRSPAPAAASQQEI